MNKRFKPYYLSRLVILLFILMIFFIKKVKERNNESIYPLDYYSNNTEIQKQLHYLNNYKLSDIKYFDTLNVIVDDIKDTHYYCDSIVYRKYQKCFFENELDSIIQYKIEYVFLRFKKYKNCGLLYSLYGLQNFDCFSVIRKLDNKNETKNWFMVKQTRDNKN